jgi:hypothetical protein
VWGYGFCSLGLLCLFLGGGFILFCVGLLFILFFGLWMFFSLLFGSIENTLLLFVIGVIRGGKVKNPFFLLLFSSFLCFLVVLKIL